MTEQPRLPGGESGEGGGNCLPVGSQGRSYRTRSGQARSSVSGARRAMKSPERIAYVVEEPGGGIAFVHRALLDHFAKSYLGPIDQVWTPKIKIPQKTIEVVRLVDQELVRRLAKQPSDLYRLLPRDFEKLIAELFRDRGWTVELTKQTRDGGSDIIAVRGDVNSQVKLLIEAKRYGPDKPVGVGIVRQLYGVRQLRHASKAVLATTSYFSDDAYKEFASVMPWELELNDYRQILEWLNAYGRK